MTEHLEDQALILGVGGWVGGSGTGRTARVYDAGKGTVAGRGVLV